MRVFLVVIVAALLVGGWLFWHADESGGAYMTVAPDASAAYLLDIDLWTSGECEGDEDFAHRGEGLTEEFHVFSCEGKLYEAVPGANGATLQPFDG